MPWSRDAAGNVSASVSDNVTITTGGVTTKMADIVPSLKIDVFPNPCTDQMTVRFSQTPEPGSRVEIMDITGRNVVSREITNAEERFSQRTIGRVIYGKNESRLHGNGY